MIKFYDTNVLINMQDIIFNCEDRFYISNITYKELEHIKTSHNKTEEAKYKAREAVRWLDRNEDKYDIIIFKPKMLKRKFRFYELNDDLRILACVNYKTKKKLFQPKEDIVFVTSDITCKNIATSLGIKTSKPIIETKDDYTGFITVKYDDEELAEFYSHYFFKNIPVNNILPNQYLIIKDKNDLIIDKYRWDGHSYVKITKIKPESKIFGKVGPIENDVFQELALDCLSHNQITMLRGKAGSGKSYLSFGYMFNLLEKGKIDKIICFCNTIATKGSAKLGFYPGTRTEKLLDSQIGNFLISKLGDRYAVEKLINDGQLVLLPMSDIRGFDTTGMNAAIYITEAQNLDIDLMKLALQRIGDDCICILDGDDKAQVDLDMYAGSNNGLRRVSQVFRGESYYGEITLQRIHRSKIAERAELM